MPEHSPPTAELSPLTPEHSLQTAALLRPDAAGLCHRMAEFAFTDAGELDENTVLLSSVDSPPPPTLTLTINSNLVAWTPPSVGKIASYNIYLLRCVERGCIAGAHSARSTTASNTEVPATPSFNDVVNDTVHAGATCPATATCYNTTYVYSVTSVVLVESLFSKTVTGEIPHLFVLGNSATVVYGATIPAPAYTIYGDVSGSLSSGVSCVYSPSAPRNVGTYSLVCSGPASTSATDGVTYNAPYLTFTPGVLTITQRPITVPAAASNKVYDGTVSSPTTPTITSGTLAYSDTVTWTETYDNRNVGTTHVLTPSGTVSDGNGGSNYKVTFVPYSPGIITVRPITVTASAATGSSGGRREPHRGGAARGDTGRRPGGGGGRGGETPPGGGEGSPGDEGTAPGGGRQTRTGATRTGGERGRAQHTRPGRGNTRPREAAAGERGKTAGRPQGTGRPTARGRNRGEGARRTRDARRRDEAGGTAPRRTTRRKHRDIPNGPRAGTTVASRQLPCR